GGLGGVDPHRVEALAVVVDVVDVQLGGAGHLIVAVDGGGAEGQHLVFPGNEGALEASGQDGGGVHLPVRDGEADGVAVGGAALGGGGQGVVQQHRAVAAGHRLALGAGQAGAQAQLGGLVQLRRRERAGQVGGGVAQQPQGRGAGRLQADRVVGAEGAVGVAGQPVLLDRDADVGRVGGAAVHIGEQAAHQDLLVDRLPVGGDHGQHPG